MHSNPTIIIAIAVLIAAIVAVALLLARRNKSLALQRRLGKEYDRTVPERGSEREAQAVFSKFTIGRRPARKSNTSDSVHLR